MHPGLQVDRDQSGRYVLPNEGCEPRAVHDQDNPNVLA